MFLGVLLCSMMIKTALIVSNWEDLFWVAVNDFVPKKKISGKQVPLWIDAEVKALCCKMDKMSRKALKEKDQVYIDKFKSLRKNVRKFIRLKYNTYIKNLADKVESNSKRNFYICLTDASKSCRLPPAIRRHLSDANPVVNPTDQAKLFNNYSFILFLIMLIMNLLHLAAMQTFMFVSVYLILHCLYLMSLLLCSTLILQRFLVLMEYPLYS